MLKLTQFPSSSMSDPPLRPAEPWLSPQFCAASPASSARVSAARSAQHRLVIAVHGVRTWHAKSLLFVTKRSLHGKRGSRTCKMAILFLHILVRQAGTSLGSSSAGCAEEPDASASCRTPRVRSRIVGMAAGEPKCERINHTKNLTLLLVTENITACQGREQCVRMLHRNGYSMLLQQRRQQCHANVNKHTPKSCSQIEVPAAV